MRTMRKKYVIINRGRLFGPLVIADNDGGVYDNLVEAIRDMARAARVHGNDTYYVHELGPEVAAAADYDFCAKCRTVYPKGISHRCYPEKLR